MGERFMDGGGQENLSFGYAKKQLSKLVGVFGDVRTQGQLPMFGRKRTNVPSLIKEGKMNTNAPPHH
jgi:hypothetical protein